MAENDEQSAQDIYGYDSIKTFATLWTNKIFIILFVTISTAASVIIALQLPVQYVASVNAVPPKSSQSMFEGAIGNITSALKDFGLTSMSGKSEGYSMMVILQSRTVQDSIIRLFNLQKRYRMENNTFSEVRNEFLENLEVTIEKEGNYTITIWDEDKSLAADIANTYIKLSNDMAIKVSRDETKQNRLYLEERLVSIDNSLKYISDSLEKFTGKTLVFSPMDQAKSFSTAIADLKAKKIENEVLYELFKSNYGPGDIYTQYQKQLTDEISQKVNDIESKPGFVGNFALKDASKIGMEYLKLYTQVETFTKVKAILLPMLEKARLDEQRFTYSLFIVDEAIPADKKDRPKRSIIILGTFAGSIVLAILISLFYSSFNNFIRKYNNLKNR